MMPGQGRPLPDFMKLDGEWIEEGYLFLYHPREESHPGKPTFTVHQERHDGELCLGIDSGQLAAAFGISVAALIEANKTYALIPLGVANAPPIYGGSDAKAYGFRIGDATASVTFEGARQEGSA